MAKPSTRALTAGLLFALPCCNLIAGIGEGNLRHRMECATVTDCVVKVPECRTALSCEGHHCVYEDMPENTPLAQQVPGDCARIVCDGTGNAQMVPEPADIVDDGNVCTLDVCNGTVPAHTLAEILPCYMGPPATKGRGSCSEGIQYCDPQGNPLGGCEGQVLPQPEECDGGEVDEDCDGQVNEEGVSCVCKPGEIVACYSGPPGTEVNGICHGGIQTCSAGGLGYGGCFGEQIPQVEDCDPSNQDEDCDAQANEEGTSCTCGDGYLSIGEACDDGNLDSMDACNELCQPSACGDGFLQPGLGELCDDGNLDSADACNELCQPSACGDGFLQPALGELCDDGNLDSTDACNELCQPSVCGDGFLQPGLGELCDDGNLDSTDACTAYCKPAVCGDGFLQRGESCDDGNTKDGDGCSAMCVAQIFAIAANYTHTCALSTAGRVKCWGGNNSGQLGLGDTAARGDQPNEMVPALPEVDLGPSQTAIAITAGGSHTCSVLQDGRVKCWGNNTNGPLGLGDELHRGDAPLEMGSNLPSVSLGAGKTATQVVGGGTHTCAILNNDSVKCWGYNPYGQLGQGDNAARGDQPNEMGDALPAINLGTGKTATTIATGSSHACALLEDGSVKCWGANQFGQLGLGDTLNRGDQPNEMGDALPAIDLGTGKTAAAVATGSFHTCVVINDGAVKCWGYNPYGQLGLPGMSNRGDQPGEMGDNLPSIDVGAGKFALAISTGFDHTCALLNDGTVRCWGYDAYGQLGLGGNPPPVNLGTGMTATVLSAGGNHTCVTLNAGVKCWGYNVYGQLGLGDNLNRGDQPNEMGDNLPFVVP